MAFLCRILHVSSFCLLFSPRNELVSIGYIGSGWHTKCTSYSDEFRLLCSRRDPMVPRAAGAGMTSQTAFDTIESAQEFLGLLREAVEEARETARTDIAE